MSYNVLNHEKQAGKDSDNEYVFNGTVSGKVPVYENNVVTLAEVNAGKTIIPGQEGRTITVLDFKAVVSGTFLTGTSVELEDTSAATQVASTAAAGLTDGNVLNEVEANTTVGAGYLGALPVGEGLAVTKTGSDFTGGTSITYRVIYTVA